MNFELKPATAGECRLPLYPGGEPVHFGEETTPPPVNTGDVETEKSAFALLRLENSSLRRLVELIEKNQRLREKLYARCVQPEGESPQCAH
jgi:hypothetical protein